MSLHGFAWVAVAPLLVALRGARLPRALLLGYVAALAGCWAVADWVPASISLYFDQSKTFGVVFFLLVVSVMVAPYYMAFAAIYAALARRFRTALPWLAAAAWTAAEWARSALFTATPVFSSNPWALLGYSQAGIEELRQLAAVTGVYGLSFILVLVNATLADLAVDAWQRRRLDPAWAALRLASAALPALAGLLYGLAALRGAAAEDLRPADVSRVAVVQGHLGLAERWHRHFHGRNLTKYLELTHEALQAGGVELVVWPEAAMTFFLEDEPSYRQALARVLGPAGVELVAGIPRRGDDGTGYYNSVYLLSEQAELRARYDKQHLLPWAEYIPLATFEAVRGRFERFRAFDRGGPAALLPTRAGPAGVLLCNEAALPEVARERVRAGAVYLLNPANDSWSRDPRFSAQWFDIISLRATEQRRYMVRASTAGPSVILDPWGRVQVRTERLERGWAVGRIRPRSDLSVYARVGDLFAALCAAALPAAFVLGRRPERRR
jgi:apolipoprotein N-acyltransferase